MTAKSSATTAGGNGRTGLIVAVRVETKSLVMDEDDIVFSLQGALAHINEGYRMNEYMSINTYIRHQKLLTQSC